MTSCEKQTSHNEPKYVHLYSSLSYAFKSSFFGKAEVHYWEAGNEVSSCCPKIRREKELECPPSPAIRSIPPECSPSEPGSLPV